MRALAWAAVLCSTCVVRAEFNTRNEFVGEELHVRIHDGYPRANDNFSSPATVGLELANRSDERSVEVTFEGDAQLTRRVHLPAREQATLFLYLPQRAWGGVEYGRLRVTDLANGATEAWTIDARTDVNPLNHFSVARLGTITAAFNVDAPWHLAGALDDHVPDDWRGLAGLNAVVVEQAQLQRWRTSFPVLKDWVVAGGLLIIATTQQELAQP
ncbi:MAG: hypothetical protein RL701_3898, partial [Pseudomonadota bacterium]